MAGTELGWQPLFDEGIRLLAATDDWTGIKAALTLPKEFASPNKESYFNFYLGINGARSTIEAGISYSENVSKYKEAGWHAFINIDGAGTNQPISITPGETLIVSLELIKGTAKLAAGKYILPARATTLKSGAPKMCIALHEDKQKNRTTWFDQASFACQGVWSGGKYQLLGQTKAKFRASEINLKQIKANIAATSMTARMPQP